ncbi:MAG: amidohydrolase/deacetylase family metallohydrolase [Gemmatimonadetes bacterium]|jgi:dihydroorotase|nr:amidohydrolase/deacetylase family metallohydrolase [Gemmatimonadota bacterium]MBT7864036.1 amidohydrolase/deacetylase family metallohydrolase [Gemmatimonadota bacterium]
MSSDSSQTYDLLLTGAQVLDPSQALQDRVDVAVRDGRIAAVGPNLTGVARERIDLTGRLLTPGWIDIHAHIYAGATTWGIRADALCLSTGVTTIVDAGSPGWANLPGFIDYIATPSRTRVLTFVHVSGIGLIYGPIGECEDIRYADPERTAAAIERWREVCVGVKVRQGRHQVGDNGVEPLRLAVQAGRYTKTPVMTHIAVGVPLADVLDQMRPGDIVTHCYQGTGDGILGIDDEIEPAVREARERGILFDVGHGGGSFRFDIARAAMSRGFMSDVISTDLHAHNIDGPVFSLAETASKLLNLGVSLEEVVRQCTAAPAAAIGRPELGTLAVGSAADLAVFDVREGGQFEFRDVAGEVLVGERRIEPHLTVRAGTVYRPADLAAECEEAVSRAREMRAFTVRDFRTLGWAPPA